MKRCPACSRVYDDEGLRFCLDDGTNLVDKLPAEPIPATLVLPVSEAPAATMKQTQPPEVPSLHQTRPRSTTAAAHRKRNVLLWIIIAALLIPFVTGALVGGYAFFKRRALTWHLVLEVQPEPDAPNRGDATNQAANVIEKRLDALGVNYRVTPDRDGRILVDLSGATDPERVKQVITAAGKLELMHVISPPNPAPVQTYSTIEEAVASFRSGDKITPNRRVAVYDETGRSLQPKYVVVEDPAIVDGADLRDASAVSDSGENYLIAFTLNRAGADKFGQWTSSHINEYLAVVLNDDVKSIAFIRSLISDQGQISGRFTRQSAEDLALVLKSGALPATLKIVSESIDKK
jgi:protein-export membrane protein SecD